MADPGPVDPAAYAGRAVCVTGGAGFIGSHLCDALAAHGARVTALDDLSSGLESNLAGSGVRLVRGSILDPAALADAAGDATVIFHLAAIASVPRSVKEPRLYVEVNARGTLEVLECARTAGARVVLASSSSAYGEQPGMPRTETMPPDPRSPYAASKLAAEFMVRAYAECHGLSAVSLRYFNIFGPRQRHDSPYAAVIPRFVAAMRADRPITLYGDGMQTRDFTFVANAVDANLRAGAAAGPLRGEVINVACGERATVLEIVAELGRLLGIEPRIERAPPRPGEVMHSLADLSRAKAMLGYEPTVGWREGVGRTVGGWECADG